MKLWVPVQLVEHQVLVGKVSGLAAVASGVEDLVGPAAFRHHPDFLHHVDTDGVVFIDVGTVGVGVGVGVDVGFDNVGDDVDVDVDVDFIWRNFFSLIFTGGVWCLLKTNNFLLIDLLKKF